MKRAEAEVIAAPFFKFHKFAHHINYINAGSYNLYGMWRNHLNLKILKQKNKESFEPGFLFFMASPLVSLTCTFGNFMSFNSQDPDRKFNR